MSGGYVNGQISGVRSRIIDQGDERNKRLQLATWRSMLDCTSRGSHRYFASTLNAIQMNMERQTCEQGMERNGLPLPTRGDGNAE
jgi:hypothetical protein